MNPAAPTNDHEESADAAAAPDLESLSNVPLTPSGLMQMFGKDLAGLRQTLQAEQTCQLNVFDLDSQTTSVIAEFRDTRFEAPNWGVDGKTLYLNGDGEMWSFPLDSPSEPHRLAYADVPALNNDHVLDPKGEAIFMSAMDGHIYRGELDGTAIAQVTSEDDIWHFLHGISPDGDTLGFVRITGEVGPARLALIPAHGGPVKVIDTGDGSIDGPEWSPDGEWIYFNTERWATQPGHAQIARVRNNNPNPDTVERLVFSDTVDWFPHIAPDGKHAVYLQYASGTIGHPENRPVELVVVSTRDWTNALVRLPLFGGQGTINVNSWSPDSRKFAFVSYPISNKTN